MNQIKQISLISLISLLSWVSLFGQTFTGNVRVTGVTIAADPTPCGPFTYACASFSLTNIIYPSSAPNIGGLTGAGNTFTDPVFGSSGVRLTDATTTDPHAVGTNGFDNYQVSNGGDAGDFWWSSDDRLTLANSSGASIYLIALNPSTLAVSRPYSGVGSGCPRAPCSTYGGWSIGNVNAYFSETDPCKLYAQTNTTVEHFEFGSDVSPSNSCSNLISGPPATTVDFNFIEVSGNCLPVDFGTPTWTSTGGQPGINDNRFVLAAASAMYNDGTGTGQNHGIYEAVWDNVKGCISLNTKTGAIVADLGWAGGTGLTCGVSKCTGTITESSRWAIHDTHTNYDGSRVVMGHTICISGSCPSDNPYMWIVGTNVVFWAEDSVHTSGHTVGGAIGWVNDPGAPTWEWYYRTSPTSGIPGAPTAINLLPTPTGVSIDMHAGWQMDNSSDTNPFCFATSLHNSASNSFLLPLDQPLSAWWSEIDCALMDGSGKVAREALTFNTGWSIFFAAYENIISCSRDGVFCSTGSDWFNTLGNAAGNSLSCIPNGPDWIASHTYPLNYIINPNTNNVANDSFKVTGNGASSNVQPNWDAACGVSCSDGGVTWTNIGAPTGANACHTDVIAWKLR